jgi:predicted nucleotidyltransferase component of viral defense system
MLSRDNPYFSQVDLLVALLPLVREEECFALKGGSAINLFVRDLPRLSVDIDLAYLPVEDRATSLANITRAMSRIAERVARVMKDASVKAQSDSNKNILKLLVRRQGVLVKIETSPVMRGSVFAPEMQDVAKSIEDQFSFTRMQLLHKDELYAGKLCAALGRQHPRDLFDIKILLDSDGITAELMDVFIVYLISGNRPISELLAPQTTPLERVFNEQFTGMELTKITLAELEEARIGLISQVHGNLTDKHRRFLLSFKATLPDWALLKHKHAETLPAIQWKLHNIRNMPKKKHQVALSKLENILYG